MTLRPINWKLKMNRGWSLRFVWEFRGKIKRGLRG